MHYASGHWAQYKFTNHRQAVASSAKSQLLPLRGGSGSRMFYPHRSTCGTVSAAAGRLRITGKILCGAPCRASSNWKDTGS